MTDTPSYLQDAKTLLSKDGFKTNNVWYHGTTSALASSILETGLKCSGDQAMNQATKKTMATIGNNYTESTDPIFVCPSRELAFYWAQQTVKRRGNRFSQEEQPVVIRIELPPELADQVKPDVGAVSLSMLEEGEQYLAFLAKLYQQNNAGPLDIDLRKADRMDYLNKLGLGYYQDDIDAKYLSMITE